MGTYGDPADYPDTTLDGTETVLVRDGGLTRSATVAELAALGGGTGGSGSVFPELTIINPADPYPMLRITPDGAGTWQSPLRAPYVGNHVIGAVGTGHDTELYLERAHNVSTILTLQMNRPGSLPGIEPAITSASVFPMTSGSVTVADASDLPSGSAGPYALGTAAVRVPSVDDDFNRANSTTTMGAPWVPVAPSVWGISSNQAKLITPGTGQSVTLVDTGTGNHRVRCDFYTPVDAEGSSAGLILNWIDANNYILIVYSQTFATWSVYKFVSGTGTFLHNAGSPRSFNIPIQAEVTAAGYLYVWFDNGPAIVTNVGTGFVAGHKAGLRYGPSLIGGNGVRFDNFTVMTTTPASWTGKTGNTLTGFTATGVTGTATPDWAVVFADGTSANLVAAYDSAGAPIWNLRAYGGQHTTDNVTMGGGLGAQVGMSFLSLAGRTPPALVLYGDAPETGSGYDANSGTFLRRDAAYRIRSGGRLFVSPTDLRPGGVVAAGTAANPHIGIGNADTGLFLKTSSPDSIGVAVDGVEVAVFDSTGLVGGGSGGTAAPAIPMPPTMSLGSAGNTLSTTLAAMTGSGYVLDPAMFTIPSGYKLQARAAMLIGSVTLGDTFEAQMYDEVTAAAVSTTAALTSTTTHRQRIVTAWADAPTGGPIWRGTVRMRNATAARGIVSHGQIELQYVATTGGGGGGSLPAGTFPTVSTVGLAGVGLTESDLTLYTGPTSIPAGTYDKYLFTGNYSIASGVNVTITRSKLKQPSAGWCVIRVPPGSTGTLTITDWDADGTLAGQGAYMLAGRNITAKRGNVWGADNGGIFDGDALLEDTIVHDLGFVGPTDGSGSHPDCWEHNGGGSNITFRNCVFDARMPAGKWATGALQLNAENGAVNNLTVDHCKMIVTTGYALYLDHKSSTISNLTVKNSTFDVTGSAYGEVYDGHTPQTSYTEWSGNVTETGSTVARPS